MYTKDKVPGLITHTSNKYVRRMEEDHIYEKAPPSIESSATQIGRPKGSTNMKKHHLKEVVLAAKNEIATNYLKEKGGKKKETKIEVTKWVAQQ